MMVKYYVRDDTIMLLQQINNDYIIMAYNIYIYILYITTDEVNTPIGNHMVYGIMELNSFRKYVELWDFTNNSGVYIIYIMGI